MLKQRQVNDIQIYSPFQQNFPRILFEFHARIISAKTKRTPLRTELFSRACELVFKRKSHGRNL